ncbi:hypothetical protein PDE_08697 [Penicillium oxalicum 114-2]|uniref:Uncharacterized protein n=1 Tax=Penicillium oxalicum (strain 114-2 / CGMCC 5302) TaxID=933388 RepID=S7ZSQ0_PENO1|nr:hypothetical protein PDE_08697 [Penicillium oxalicum 114-2]
MDYPWGYSTSQTGYLTLVRLCGSKVDPISFGAPAKNSKPRTMIA